MKLPVSSPSSSSSPVVLEVPRGSSDVVVKEAPQPQKGVASGQPVASAELHAPVQSVKTPAGPAGKSAIARAKKGLVDLDEDGQEVADQQGEEVRVAAAAMDEVSVQSASATEDVVVAAASGASGSQEEGAATTDVLLAQAPPASSEGMSSNTTSTENPRAGNAGWAVVAGIAGIGIALSGGSSPPPPPVDTTLENMTPAQAAALTPAQVAAYAQNGDINRLNDAAEGALLPSQMTLVTSTGVSLMTNEFLESLAPATLAGFSDSQLDTLNAAQVGAITAGQIDALAPAQVVALGTDVSGLSNGAAASLNAAQTAALSSNGLLTSLSTTAVASLAPDSLDSLTPAEIAALPTGFVDDLAPATLASLSAAQVAALTPAQAGALTPAQVAALAQVDLLDDLSDLAEAALQPSQMALISQIGVQALDNEFLESLTSSTLAGLSNAQLGYLTAGQVGVISAAQVDNLTAAQVAALGADVSGMSNAAAASLNAAQVAALAAAGFLDDLSSSAAASLVPGSLGDVTPAQFANLAPSFVDDLAPATLATASNSQVAAMSSAQAAVLTPAQVAALESAGLLHHLGDAQEASLAVDSLDNIASLAALPAEFIQDLAPATLASISGAQAGTVNTSQAAVVTDAQFNALETAGLLPSFTPAALAVMYPTLDAVALDNQTALDVRSNIVLNFSHSLTAVAGKYIRIVDDGNTWIRGENINNTQVLEATDPRVTIVGGRVTINPQYDLDFGSNYHIEIDDGAFISSNNGRGIDAISNSTTINFTTVTPAVGAVGEVSVISDATGAMVTSLTWWDAEDRGNPSAPSGTPINASGGNHAYVIADYITTPADPGNGDDGVGVGDFKIIMNNFGNGDLLYVDNLGANTSFNAPNASNYLDYGDGNTTVVWAAKPGSLGGDIVFTGLVFSSPGEFQTAIGSSYVPYVIA